MTHSYEGADYLDRFSSMDIHIRCAECKQTICLRLRAQQDRQFVVIYERYYSALRLSKKQPLSDKGYPIKRLSITKDLYTQKL